MESGEDGQAPALRLALRYGNAIQRAGGIAVVLSPSCGPSDLEHTLERVDGLLLTGGDDFDTQRLGLGATHPDATPVPTAKQDFDLLLARTALDRGLPTLGICYGMQLLALADGATLHQHLPDDRPGSGDHSGGVQHPIHVLAGSKLAKALGVEPGPVISRHHQALDRVPSPWVVTARAACGLVEAIEHADHPFALGVQWHPELADEGGPQDGLFRALVSAAGLAAVQKPKTSPCQA